jgi:hypothetical protein
MPKPLTGTLSTPQTGMPVPTFSGLRQKMGSLFWQKSVSCRRPWALPEQKRVLRGRRGGRDEVDGILEGDAGVAALVLVVAADVSPFVSMVDRDYVITHLTFELADGDGLPARVQSALGADCP